MPVRLTLLCHAATEAVRDAAFPRDEPLDAQGRAKAAALAPRLRRVDAAWTSPALRARETVAALRREAVVAPALRDVDLGRWAGRSLASVAAAEPDAVAAWTGSADAAPHGGESVVDVLARVTPWLAAICGGDGDRSDGGRVLAVTHAAVMRAAIVLALDAAPLAFWRIDIAPLCRVSLAGSGGRWTLRTIGG